MQEECSCKAAPTSWQGSLQAEHLAKCKWVSFAGVFLQKHVIILLIKLSYKIVIAEAESVAQG